MKSCTSAVLLFLIPIMISAQTKPIAKIELMAGVGLKSGNGNIFLPAVYIPVHQHIDLGVSYNTMKVNYSGQQNYRMFIGTITYKFPSFYIKFNISNDLKRFNPFIGYFFSRVKGSHHVVDYELFESNFPEGGYGIDSSRMTSAEQAQLEKALAKTESAHGFQAGVELRLIRNLSFFIKGTVFTLGQKAFPWLYIGNTYSYNKQLYGMAGVVIKFYALSNKKLIK